MCSRIFSAVFTLLCQHKHVIKLYILFHALVIIRGSDTREQTIYKVERYVYSFSAIFSSNDGHHLEIGRQGNAEEQEKLLSFHFLN